MNIETFIAIPREISRTLIIKWLKCWSMRFASVRSKSMGSRSERKLKKKRKKNTTKRKRLLNIESVGIRNEMRE